MVGISIGPESFNLGAHPKPKTPNQRRGSKEGSMAACTEFHKTLRCLKPLRVECLGPKSLNPRANAFVRKIWGQRKALVSGEFSGIRVLGGSGKVQGARAYRFDAQVLGC